jgi:hypothetical protein
VSDEYQGRLGSKMQRLTHGDRNMPMVAMGWNSERYQGRNLALRLVALGYTNVYWYRGGPRGLGGGWPAGSRAGNARPVTLLPPRYRPPSRNCLMASVAKLSSRLVEAQRRPALRTTDTTPSCVTCFFWFAAPAADVEKCPDCVIREQRDRR